MGRAPFYTLQRVQDIVESLRKGLTRDCACRLAGISRTDFDAWFKDKKRRVVDSEVDQSEGRKTISFARAVERAEAIAEEEFVSLIRKASTPRLTKVKKTKRIPTKDGGFVEETEESESEFFDVKLAQWYLERKYPEKWGAKAKDQAVDPPDDRLFDATLMKIYGREVKDDETAS